MLIPAGRIERMQGTSRCADVQRGRPAIPIQTGLPARQIAKGQRVGAVPDGLLAYGVAEHAGT